MLSTLKSICPLCLILPAAAIGVAVLSGAGAAWTSGSSGTAGPELPRPEPVPAGYKLTDDDRSVIEAHAGDERFVLGHELKRITGEPEPLMKYHGRVVMIVNVASRCGLTPQYAGLESLYRAHHEDGLVILGLPANNFMGQEPGTNKEIMEFCTERFDVSFPMFEKISVKGDDRHPLYEQLAALPEPDHEGPTWNFTKYLVGRDGRVIQRFGPRTAPDDPKMAETIAEALKAEGVTEDG